MKRKLWPSTKKKPSFPIERVGTKPTLSAGERRKEERPSRACLDSTRKKGKAWILLGKAVI